MKNLFIYLGLVVMGSLTGTLMAIGAGTVYESVTATATPIADTPRCNLPCKCAPYYNLGTSEWAECMGVELK